MRKRAIFAAMAVVGLAGCTSPDGPTRVTRFHLGAPIDRGSVLVEPLGGPASLEAGAYVAAVQGELVRIGYQPANDVAGAQFLASVSFSRDVRPMPPGRPPISIGIGGGSFGGGFGGGGSIGFGVGKRPSRDQLVAQLSVQIKHRTDGSVVWEGRAQTAGNANSAAAQPGAAAIKLARALFQGFPGESGRTITVR